MIANLLDRLTQTQNVLIETKEELRSIVEKKLAPTYLKALFNSDMPITDVEASEATYEDKKYSISFSLGKDIHGCITVPLNELVKFEEYVPQEN